MAISNPTAVGNLAQDATSSTIATTTTGTIPAGAKIWVVVGWFGTSTLSSISDGTNSYTIDQQSKSGGGNTSASISSADAPSGLASGTTITATFSAATAGDRSIGIFYSTGVQTGAGAAYGATGANSASSSTAWATGNITVASGDILIGFSHWEDSSTTTSSTPGGSNQEIIDWPSGGTAGSAQTAVYQIGTGAAIQGSGTWSNACSVGVDPTRSVAVAYTAAAVAAGGGAPTLIYPNRFVGPQAARFTHVDQDHYWWDSVGGIAPQTFLQELDATAVAVTAAIQKQVNKIVTATSVAVTASMQRQANKTLSATAVAVTASIQKQVNKTLAATAVVVTAALSMVKVKLQALTATAVVVTATMQRQVNKTLSATAVAVTASIQKQVNKTLTATAVAVTASLTSLKVILKTLTATAVVVTASMQRKVLKNLSATSVVTGSIQKLVTKTLSASSTVTATLDALKGGIIVFLTGAFDALTHRFQATKPTDQEWTSSPGSNMDSSPQEGEYDP